MCALIVCGGGQGLSETVPHLTASAGNEDRGVPPRAPGDTAGIELSVRQVHVHSLVERDTDEKTAAEAGGETPRRLRREAILHGQMQLAPIDPYTLPRRFPLPGISC